LNENIQVVMRELARQIARVGNLFDKGKGDIARAILFQAYFWALEGKAQSDTQLALLNRSQRGKYQPFISGEVNRAIANSQGAIKPLLEILKLFGGNTTIMPHSSTDEQSSLPTGTNGNAYLTIEAANKLVQQGAPLMLTQPEVLEAKIIEMGTLPCVNPNLQGGDILRGQSLSKGGPATTDPEIKADNEDRKTRRREIEDIESWDEFKA